MPEIVTDFQPFENSKKPLKTMAHCDSAPRFLPTKIREDPPYYSPAGVVAGTALDVATLPVRVLFGGPYY
jgi:hypothetical protein